MANKENTQATIAELMAREASEQGDRSIFFNKPEVISTNNQVGQAEERIAKLPEEKPVVLPESIRQQREEAHQAADNIPAMDSGEQTPPEKREVVAIRDHLRSLNMLIPGSDQHLLYSDEYRRVKRPLLSNAFGKTSQLVEQGNLILVTSSIPGEGKTYTAINLALSIAQERDHTVLLVDCDVIRQGTSRMLQVAEKPGLVELLETDQVSVGDVLLATDVPSLSLISAGKQHEYVTELLASQRMQAVVEEISKRYDDRIIIFDAPPILPTPQTHVLAELAGQIVFVIEAGKTPQSVVEDALEMLPEGSATSLLMNKSVTSSKRGNYYSGYYGPDSK